MITHIDSVSPPQPLVSALVEHIFDRIRNGGLFSPPVDLQENLQSVHGSREGPRDCPCESPRHQVSPPDPSELVRDVSCGQNWSVREHNKCNVSLLKEEKI